MGFGMAFMNPPLLWILVFKHLMKPYGIFLVPAIIAERKYVFRSIVQTGKTVNEDENPNNFLENLGKTKKGGGKRAIADPMARPYLNIIRMHLLIFFFAFCHFLKIDSFFVYALVYFVYFFPWDEIKRLRTGPTN